MWSPHLNTFWSSRTLLALWGKSIVNILMIMTMSWFCYLFWKTFDHLSFCSLLLGIITLIIVVIENISDDEDLMMKLTILILIEICKKNLLIICCRAPCSSWWHHQSVHNAVHQASFWQELNRSIVFKTNKKVFKKELK